MTSRTHRSPLACTAIAAVLAAASTPVFAQDSAVPDPAPPPATTAPAPIVLPEIKAAPITPPAAEPSAAVPEPASTSSTTRSTRTVARNTARAAPAAATAASRTAAPEAVSAPTADTTPLAAPSEPAPVASTTPIVQPARATRDDGTSAEIGLGILGVLALGGLGAYAARRRRVSVTPAVHPDELARTPTTPEFDAATGTATLPEPAEPAWTPAIATVPPVAAFERRPDPTPARTAPSGAASAAMIPPGPLPTGAAMHDLFERMVAAPPDRDNPFTSDRRRRARVRWLMKQHEYRLRDPDGLSAADRFNAADQFDFRTYTPSSQRLPDEGAGKAVLPA